MNSTAMETNNYTSGNLLQRNTKKLTFNFKIQKLKEHTYVYIYI